jgi:hypothetical protein
MQGRKIRVLYVADSEIHRAWPLLVSEGFTAPESDADETRYACDK